MNMVIEMRAIGLSHGEIARELQVSRTSISSDVQYLGNQAKEYIKEICNRAFTRTILGMSYTT